MGNFTETFEFGAIYTAAGFTAPAFGQSSFAGSGINLLDMLIDDGPMATRNSTFGWMPLSYANDASQAQEKLVAHVQLAMEKSLDVMGLDYSRIEHDDTTFIVYYVKYVLYMYTVFFYRALTSHFVSLASGLML